MWKRRQQENVTRKFKKKSLKKKIYQKTLITPFKLITIYKFGLRV